MTATNEQARNLAATHDGTVRRWPYLAAVMFSMLVVTAPGAQAAAPQRSSNAEQRSAILGTFTAFKIALKDRDGETACALLSLPTRALFRRQYDPFEGWQSCVELVEVLGRSIWRQGWRRMLLDRVRTRSGYACARIAYPSNSGAMFFRRSGGVWQIHDTGDYRRFPRSCQ